MGPCVLSLLSLKSLSEALHGWSLGPTLLTGLCSSSEGQAGEQSRDQGGRTGWTLEEAPRRLCCRCVTGCEVG